MKVILSGAGTAGHIYPALAIAEEIKKKYIDAELLFIGRTGGKENRMVDNAGIPIKLLDVKGLKRRISTENIKSVLMAVRAKKEAKKIIREFSPDVVVGTGGYVAWPVVKAAQSLGIPTVIHESNVSPGLSTRLLAKKCNAVLLNHESTKEHLPKKCNTVTVGNPLRDDFFSITRQTARRRLGLRENDVFIVSFGGSGGAKTLNDAIIGVMKSFSRKATSVRHLHACGGGYYDSLAENELKRGADGCKILPYINNMPEVMHAADIAISRCGAMTLSELSAVGVAAILIPSPNVTDNHQYKNAKELSERGAAILITENELTEKLLTEKICELAKDKQKRKSYAEKIKNKDARREKEKALSEIEKTLKKSD